MRLDSILKYPVFKEALFELQTRLLLHVNNACLVLKQGLFEKHLYARFSQIGVLR
jgi:hypothetical protein